MKKILYTMLFLFFAAGVTYGQDIIYTVSGELNNQKVALDSIMVENLSNNTWMTFNDLPDEQYYQINLTKKAFWGTIGVNDFGIGSGFVETQNLPGSIVLSYKRNTPERFNLSIFNIAGQKIYSESNKLINPGNSILVQPGAAGVYLVRIETSNEAQSFKVTGLDLEKLNKVKVIDGTTINPPTKSATLSTEDNFAFNIGDSIRVSVFKSNNFASPLKRKLNISENLKFIFEELSDSTMMVTTGKLQLNAPGLELSGLKVLSSFYESDVNMNGTFQVPNFSKNGSGLPVLFTQGDDLLFGAVPVDSNGSEISLDEVLLFYFKLFPDVAYLGVNDNDLLGLIASDANYSTLLFLLNNALNENKAPTESSDFLEKLEESAARIVETYHTLEKSAMIDFIDSEFKFEYERNGTIIWPKKSPVNASIGIEIKNNSGITEQVILEPFEFIFSPSSLIAWGIDNLYETPPPSLQIPVSDEGDITVCFSNGMVGTEMSNEFYNKIYSTNNRQVINGIIFLVLPEMTSIILNECVQTQFEILVDAAESVKKSKEFGASVQETAKLIAGYGVFQLNKISDCILSLDDFKGHKESRKFIRELSNLTQIIDVLGRSEKVANLIMLYHDFYLSNIGDSETRHFYNGVLYGDLSFDGYADDLFNGAPESEHEYSRKVMEKNFKYKIDRSITQTTFTKTELIEKAAEIPFDSKLSTGDASFEKNTVTDVDGDVFLKIKMGTEPSEIEIATPFQVSGLKDTIDLYLTDPATLEIVYGNEQTGQLGEYLNDSLVVIAKDKDGKPVPGVTVQFYTECDDCGSLEPLNEKTDKTGKFAAKWWLGKTEGTKYAMAKFLIYDDIPPVTFSAEAKFIEPSFIQIYSGSHQAPITGQYLKEPIKVKVTDKDGTPVKSAEVHFEPACDDCGITNSLATTDKNGIAQTMWKITNANITSKLKAEVFGYPNIQPVYFYTGEGFDLKKFLIENSPWLNDELEYYKEGFTFKDGGIFEWYWSHEDGREGTDFGTWGQTSENEIWLKIVDDSEISGMQIIAINGKAMTVKIWFDKGTSNENWEQWELISTKNK